MPELPEVETVRRGLAKFLPKSKIVDVQVLHPRVNRNGEEKLDSAVGARIESVNRRGKFLWFSLDRGNAIVGHLGMSGQMLIESKRAPISPHVRAIFRFFGTSDEFRFVDQRTFGWLSIDHLIATPSGMIPRSCLHIAQDPFDANFNIDEAVVRLKNRKTEIKRALLNQEIVSGIGNIYADEALWLSRIHPERKIESISQIELRNLVKNATKVMKNSLKKGGTSFDDLYIDVNGQSGYNEISLKAYGREGEPCRRCSSHIRRITFANRSSHFCPQCQRTPRTKTKLRRKPRRNRGGNQGGKRSSR